MTRGRAFFGGQLGAGFVFDLQGRYGNWVSSHVHGDGEGGLKGILGGRRGGGTTHRDLKIHHLFRKRAHLVVEAYSILADFLSREHEIPLPLFFIRHDHSVAGASHAVVYIEGAAGLDLSRGGEMRVSEERRS